MKKFALLFSVLLVTITCTFVFFGCGGGSGDGIDGDEFKNVAVSEDGTLTWTKLNRAKKYEILSGKFGTGATSRETTDCSFDLTVFSLKEGKNYVTLLGIEDNDELGETIEMEFAIYEMVIEKKSGVYTLYACSYSDEYLSLSGFEEKDGVVTKYIQPTFYSDLGGATYTSMPKDIKINGDNIWGLYSDSEYKNECGSQTITGLKRGHNYYYIKLNDKNGTFLKGYKVDFYILDKVDVVLYSKTGEKLFETNVWENDALDMSILYANVGASDYIAYNFEPIERDVATVEIQKDASFRVISSDEYNILEHFTISYDGVLTKKADHTCDGIDTLTIPAQICGRDVITIGNGSDRLCDIKNLVISDGIKEIAKGAFRYSSTLETVSLPDSITKIGEEAFYNCNNLKLEKYGDRLEYLGNWLIKVNNGDGESVELKPTTIGIACSVFPFTDFALPDTLKSITYPDVFNYAVSEYEKNTHAEIYDDCLVYFGNWLVKVKADGKENFNGLKDSTVGILKGALNGITANNIVIPESVSYLSERAFDGCKVSSFTVSGDNFKWKNDMLLNKDETVIYYVSSAAQSITIPDGVTFFDLNLSGCPSLKTVHIGASFAGGLSLPASVENITVSAMNTKYFAQSGILYKKNDYETLIYFVPKNISGNITLADGLKEIGSYAFEGCNKITGITIPDGVTSIKWGAFRNCTSLNIIMIPDSVTSMGDSAFYGCSSLTSVTIGNGVTSIENNTFYGCSSLTSITIPNSVTSIDENAFYGCSSLKYNEYDNAYYLGNDSNPYLVLIKARDTSITSCTINENTKIIYYLAFDGCSSLTSLTIGNSVTSIDDGAFRGCSSLTSVTIPNSVTSIGDYAFYNCSSLTSVTIGNSVTSIGSEAFRNCSSLTSITIPDGVTRIENNTFYGCSSLTSITIGDSVTNIGNYAFRDCSSLTSVTIPDSVNNIGRGAFLGCALKNVVFENTQGWISYYSSEAVDFSNSAKAAEILIMQNGGDFYRN